MNAGIEYRARLEARTALRPACERQYRTAGNLRLLTAIAGVLLAFFVFGKTALPVWALMIPVLIFIALATWHARVAARLDRSKRSVAFYTDGLARLEERWAGLGESGERYRDAAHVYAEDLDLFGKGSLYQLLCTARTRTGEDLLAEWLKAPADADEAIARQGASLELRPRLDLREELVLLGDEVRSGVNAETLSHWAEAAPIAFPPYTRPLAFLLAAGSVITLCGWLAADWPRTPFFCFVLVEMGYSLFMRPRVEPVVEAVHAPADEMALLAAILERIEREPVSSPKLMQIRERLMTHGLIASSQIARLRRLATFHEWPHNEFFRLIAAMLLWPVHLAVGIERWRGIAGGSIREWLFAVGEFECLCAFASYGFEHPDDPFPSFCLDRALFDASGVAHPLLPEASAVRNDVVIARETPLLVVSGSNMSGKSTLLRTVGLNAVLAWAGAPVRARSLTISPLQIGASIRVQDSLLDGRSRFYAEITRLKQITALTGDSRPVLFLIDELLSGTNSHDRRIGAEAVVQELVRRGAIGIITTHDLALAHIAEKVDGGGRNVHFEDTIVEGGLHFDYRLREGVVARSNALELMRSVGLNV